MCARSLILEWFLWCRVRYYSHDLFVL